MFIVFYWVGKYTLKKKALLNQINAGIKNDEIKYKNAGVGDTGSVIMQKRLVLF